MAVRLMKESVLRSHPNDDECQDLKARYQRIRSETEALCAPLEVEDYGVQPIVEASPPKWHLAHTNWFFETFLLKPFVPTYQSFDRRFEYLFNSYYEGVGDRYPRAARGLMSRPTVDEVYRYRSFIDETMIASFTQPMNRYEWIERTILGLQHEQQHQELIITDLKANFGRNPLHPTYSESTDLPSQSESEELGFLSFTGGKTEYGVDWGGEFCFDNETPRGTTWLAPHMLATRLVTNAEYLEFIEDDGYRRPELWLSDGWSARQQGEWIAPEYWRREDANWIEYTLYGDRNVDPFSPVTHVSYYEADAYARWRGCRLPTEFEWEAAARDYALSPETSTRMTWHPNKHDTNDLSQMFGVCWQWMRTPYMPYPGFKPLPGTLGEYNGKFMSNQMVLRGSSCATPPGHARISYRNFFYPQDRWQFTGIRLARDID